MTLFHFGGSAAGMHRPLGLALLLVPLISLSAEARGQGWYSQFSLSFERLEDADGRISSGAPGSPGTSCLLGDLLGVGSLLDTVGLTDDSGCLLTLIGPGTPDSPGTASTLTRVRHKDGYGALATLGYGLANGLRPELAFHYARNDWDRVTVFTASGDPVSSVSDNRFDAYGLMANLWWDFLDSPRLRPYIGGGLGYQSLRLSGAQSDRDQGSVFQLGAGVAFPLSDFVQLAVDYRYLEQSDPQFRTGDNGALETEYTRQSLMLGLRYFFGGTARGAQAASTDTAAATREAERPVAVVPPEPPENELEKFLKDPADKSFVLRGVNFEFDSDRLLPESIAILNEAARTLNAFPDIVLDVEGHTCIIGTPTYNQSLSERRANAVRSYLATRGVAIERMRPVGYGQARPIADNSTEEGRVQNRRVEFRAAQNV